ncbi:protein transport protein HofC [Pseudenterobacter timonensis]|uniref:Protein transport protein HofC n=1 Tax=Pseudenterobacter timonensis TaxID=1755099 RepID=A0AAE4DKE0_9ENTR|nr:protein transport protein HofC [Pseudenterobacter timonensis]MDR9889370.1 protein transport protein HofC [Pseudenterobacter timonensis]
MAASQLWRWRALTQEGVIERGTIWAASRQAACDRLMKKAIFPLSLSRCWLQKRWRPEHACDLFYQLAVLLGAGLTLGQSLPLLTEQHPAPQWRALLVSLAEDLNDGSPFSAALQKWPDVFSPLAIAMMKTGELTGKLEVCCRQLAEQQKRQRQLTVKVKKALRYPLLVLTLAMGVVMAMVTLVLPEFAAIYKTFNTPLPLLTQGVMRFASFIQQWALLLIAALLSPVVAMHSLRGHPGWQRLNQKIVLRLPVAGTLVRGQKLSHIFTVLSLTQQAGIAFLEGLESTQATLESRFWQDRLAEMRERITQGATIWSSLDDSVFTPLCIQLIRTGEASGSLDLMLANLARHHHEQTFQQADSLAAILEPLLLIVTGLIIGTLVIAMYLPIFHLGDAISMG